jgi:hypothetical protein
MSVYMSLSCKLSFQRMNLSHSQFLPRVLSKIIFTEYVVYIKKVLNRRRDSCGSLF